MSDQPGEPQPIPPDARERCPNCGFLNPPAADFCRQCGARLAPPVYYSAPVQRSNCLLIALFVIIGIPALLFGACFLVLGSSTGNRPGGEFYLAPSFWVPWALGGFVVFGLFLYLAFLRKKR